MYSDAITRDNSLSCVDIAVRGFDRRMTSERIWGKIKFPNWSKTALGRGVGVGVGGGGRELLSKAETEL